MWSCDGVRGFNSLAAQDELLQRSCFVEVVVEHERLYLCILCEYFYVLLMYNILVWVINSYHIRYPYYESPPPHFILFLHLVLLLLSVDTTLHE